MLCSLFLSKRFITISLFGRRISIQIGELMMGYPLSNDSVKTCSFTTFIICSRRDFVRFEPSKIAIWPSPSRYSTASCKDRSTHLARKSTYYQLKKDRFQTLEHSSLKNSGNGEAYSGKCFERTSAQEITLAL